MDFSARKGMGIKMSYFNNLTTTLLNKNLDGLWLRQQVVMENIANYSTPNYKSKYVDFEHELKSKIDAINNSKDNVKASVIQEDISSSKIVLGENDNKTMRLDGNNVDLESENIELAKTQLNYSYTVAELNSYFAKMRIAITGTK